MIILEGPDNSGKTTLAKKLSEVVGWPLEHSGGPTTAQDRHRRMQWVFEQENIILDRVPCISEPVYGTVCRGTNCFEGTTYLTKLIKRNPLIIYCRPPTSIIVNIEHELSKYADGDHHISVENNKFAIIGAYEAMMNSIPHLYYDWTAITPNHMTLFLSYCIQYKELTDERRRSKRQPHSKAGSKRRPVKAGVQEAKGADEEVSSH